MCVAIPGKLIEKLGSRGSVDIKGNIVPVELGLVQAEVGDHVLIHAGCAISVLDKNEAEELEELLNIVGAYEQA